MKQHGITKEGLIAKAKEGAMPSLEMMDSDRVPETEATRMLRSLVNAYYTANPAKLKKF